MVRKDLDLNFVRNPLTGDVNVKKNDEAIKQSLRTLLLLGLYEKPFNENLGPNIMGYMFENYIVGTDVLIKQKITNIIKQYEPGIIIKSLNINAESNKNNININLEYYFTGNSKNNNLSISLERTR